MKDFLRVVSIFWCIGLGWHCAISEGQQTPSRGIDAIWAYSGVWKVEMEHFDTAQSKAGHEKTTLRNACWKDGVYLACNQYVDGESKILLVFTCSSTDNTCTSYQIPANGAEAGKGRLVMEGNTWIFPWQVTEDGKTTYFRVVNVFTTADKIEFRQEYSTDNARWTVTAKGTEIKTGKE
jgi:hypothetical protein